MQDYDDTLVIVSEVGRFELHGEIFPSILVQS